MTEEEQLFERRIRELAENSYRGSLFLFTDFLTEAEQGQVMSLGNVSCGVGLWGGYENAERRMARFGTEETCGYDQPYPLAVLEIAPRNPRFTEELSHRDFLGSVLGLGIERRVIGDIVTAGGSGGTAKGGAALAWIVAEEHIAGFIEDNLSQVKHTFVRVRRVDSVPENAGPALREETVQVSSERLDAVVAHVFKLSRSQSLELFRAGRVMLNGRQITSNAASPREGDTVSVRGMGKFRYLGVDHSTRKGKLAVNIAKFV